MAVLNIIVSLASDRHSSESGGSGGSVKTAAEQSELIARVLESSCSSGKCHAHTVKTNKSRKNSENSCQQTNDIDINSVKSYMSESTVSGTGLLFLRNYLKKKTALPEGSNDTTLMAEDQLNSEATMACDSHQQLVFNTVPIPFPPKNEFYGPAMYIPDDVAFCDDSQQGSSRRNSLGSTIAELLNDNFDSEDSELRNLDWEEWETEDEHQPPSISSLPSSYFETGKNQSDTDTDDASIVVDILDMAQPVGDMLHLPVLEDYQCCQSITDSEVSFTTDASESDCSEFTSIHEPTYEELQSIKEGMIGKTKRKRKITIPFLDLPSPPSSTSSGSITPIAEMSSTRSILDTRSSTPHQELTSSMSNETSHSFESINTGARRKQFMAEFDQFKQQYEPQASPQASPQAPKKRLAQFWERRVSGSFEDSSTTPVPMTGQNIVPNASTESVSKFKPAIPSYYDPEGNRKANEKIQKFLEATRKAADDTGVSVWSSNYEKLKRGELSLPYNEDGT